MRTRTIVAVTLVAAAGLVGCFPRHGHHGPWGNGWNNAGWNGDWDGPGWDNDDWDDDHWNGWDEASDDDRWSGPCHPANNFCGGKPWW